LIYRRENPTTPSKRFRSVILNPVGSKIICKSFYISKRPRVAKHFGKNVMFSKKKSIYKTTFNINYSKYQQGTGFVAQISAERRYKTFVGLVRYSNGAISCVPLFSGAYIMQLIKAWPYARTPKYIKASNIKTGSVMAIAYLSITNCFFNVTSGTNKI
jgi:ribosomal protein L2